MLDLNDFEGLFLFVGGRVVMVDPKEAELVIEDQELVQLNICEILIILIWFDFVRPAVVLVLVADRIHLLVIIFVTLLCL